MVDLDLVSQLLNGRCHGNQFWAKYGKMTFIRQAGVPKRVGIWQFRFKNIKWQYCSYILSKYDQDITRVTTARFLDETPKIVTSHRAQISWQVLERTSPAFQR